MIIELDMSSDTPIYVQLRNQIVKGIGKGEIQPGEKLPTVRQLAADAGVNTMTVNKTYQILKMRDISELTEGLEHLYQKISIWTPSSVTSWSQSWNFCPPRQA